MERVNVIKSLNIITDQYDDLVFLLVFKKQQIFKNVYIRVGYENTRENSNFCFSTRFQFQENFFTAPSDVGHEYYIVPVALRKHSKLIYIEIIDAEHQTVHFIFQRATSVCSPYTALQKYTEVQVEIKENSTLTNSQLVQDILNSTSFVESHLDEDVEIIDTQTREEVCEDVNICAKYHGVWINKKENPISIIWVNENHWNTVHEHIGNVNNRTAWPVYDCLHIVQDMNRIGRDVILKLLLHSRIKSKNTPIKGFINFGRLNAVALCKLLVREALNNQTRQEMTKMKYTYLDVDNHFLHIKYENVLSLYTIPYNVIHYPKLCEKLGINEEYVNHIVFLSQLKQIFQYSNDQSHTFYVRQGKIWTFKNKHPLKNTQDKLINATYLNLPNVHINELLKNILYNTDIVIKFDGISMVVSSDLLPAGVTIESNLDQIVEFVNVSTILDLMKKSNNYLY